MTFTGRLRLTLILAAIFPTALISIIVVIGLSQQVKRIENRDAEAACLRFAELLDNTSARAKTNLQFIIDGREFQVMEWGLDTDKPPDPKYRLPLLSLDFVEYLDSGGIVMISADRPGLVGHKIELPLRKEQVSRNDLVYENDLHGSHPSLAIIMPTEKGYVRGGFFLDGIFGSLATAVTRSSLDFIDIRGKGSEAATFELAGEVGVPYRSEEKLCAVLTYYPWSEFYPIARFLPYEQQSLFADFFTAVAVVTIFSLALIIPIGLYFSARTRREFETLSGGAVRVASGDFSRPVVITSEGEFSDLAESFNRMMKQLTDYRKKLIVSQKVAAWQTIGRKIAHEVKNPLTPISIAVDDLRKSYHDYPDEYENILNDCAATIKGEVARLKKLIDQFSTFAKMPPPEITAIPASAFIQDISVLYKEEVSEGRLTIENNLDDASLRLDTEQMRQVIINLIKNSLEAECEQCIFRLDRSDDRIRLTVEDDGPGLPEKILNEGPTPYYSTKENGSGLGLIICQRIVFDHGGMVNIENKPEGGARVVITLPETDDQNINR